MIVLLFLSSCRKDNHVPVAFVDVSPVSGVAPLSSRVKVWGTDADGLGDIVSYTLDVNGRDSTSSTPFDFTKVFSTPGTYNIFTVVTDSHGASNKSKVVSVVVSGPDNSVPVAFADVSPLSGAAPLSSRVKAWGSDADGLDDIVSYTLNVNGRDSSSSAPFDFVKVFTVPGTYKIYSVVADSHGATNKSNVVTVDVSSPPSTCSINFLSSTTGDSPLSLPLKVSGTSGNSPIVGYRLHVDDRVSSVKNSPIDTTLTLYAGSHIISAEVLTSSGAAVTSPSYNIDVNFVRGPNDEWYLLPFIPYPKGPLNLFAPRDNTPVALEYAAATNRAQRDALIASRVDGTWLSHFPPSDEPLFNCNNYNQCALVASIASLGTNLYSGIGADAIKLFDWYSGNDPALIRDHGGTFYGAGYVGLPMLALGTEGSIGGHAMNAVVSGDDLSVESFNNVDFLYNATNIKSGQYNLWANGRATYGYPFTYTTTEGGVIKNHLIGVSIIVVDYVNGVATNVRYNPNIELVKTRNGK